MMIFCYRFAWFWFRGQELAREFADKSGIGRFPLLAVAAAISFAAFFLVFMLLRCSILSCLVCSGAASLLAVYPTAVAFYWPNDSRLREFLVELMCRLEELQQAATARTEGESFLRATASPPPLPKRSVQKSRPAENNEDENLEFALPAERDDAFSAPSPDGSASVDFSSISIDTGESRALQYRSQRIRDDLPPVVKTGGRILTIGHAVMAGLKIFGVIGQWLVVLAVVPSNARLNTLAMVCQAVILCISLSIDLLMYRIGDGLLRGQRWAAVAIITVAVLIPLAAAGLFAIQRSPSGFVVAFVFACVAFGYFIIFLLTPLIGVILSWDKFE